jgi:hypothetical protein
MRIGEMLDTAIKLYRQHWKTFMGLVALILVPYLFLQAFLTRGAVPTNIFNPQPISIEDESAVRTAAIVGGIFSGVLVLFVEPFLRGAVGKAAAEVYRGESPEFQPMYRFAVRRFHSLLWVSLLTGLAVFGGLLLLIVPGVLFFVRFSFGTVVVVVEDERGRRAMGRSWRLARGKFWKILGTLVLAGILTSLVAGILQLPLTLASYTMGRSGWILRAIAVSAASIVTRPFSALVGVLLYFDARIRKEGMDIDVTARELGLIP